MQKRSFLYLVLPVLTALGGCIAAEKSENPLSPTVAGPIPGVSITSPNPLEPRDNLRIAVSQQPITLQIGNANTNGVRPLNYVVEIATDAGFTNKVFVREGINPGAGNRTELRLSDSLAPERTYYWRTKAQDGANSSEYSPPAFFTVYTPIIFQKPVPQSPIGNVQLATNSPQFVFANAARSGPVRSVSYDVQVSLTETFGSPSHWSVSEQPGTTQFSPGPLTSGVLIFWRVRAFDNAADPPVVGPYSDTAVFRTAAAAAPSPAPSGGSCVSAGSEEAIVTCRRRQFPGFMSNSQIVSFLRAVAQDLNAAGKPFAPNYGILVKTDGTQCNGFSCDIICAGQGASQRQWDVIVDVQGSQGPVWHEVGSVAARPCQAP